MNEITLQGMESLTRGIAALEKQAPFALSRALNRIALMAKEELKETLPTSFIIRTPWLAKGIRTTFARKNNLQVKIGSVDSFMKYQAGEGERKPRSGKSLAIPLAARPNPKAITRPNKWPGKMLKKPKFFALKTKQGRVYVAKRKTSKRLPLLLAWQLIDGELHSRNVPWTYARSVERVVDNVSIWNRITAEELAAALRTAQRRGGRR